LLSLIYLVKSETPFQGRLLVEWCSILFTDIGNATSRRNRGRKTECLSALLELKRGKLLVTNAGVHNLLNSTQEQASF